MTNNTKSYIYKDFEIFFKKISDELEARRKAYLRKFYTFSFITVAIIFSIFFYDKNLNAFFNKINAMIWSGDANYNNFVLYAFIILSSMFLALKPIFSYRGINRSDLIKNKFSVKNYTYSKLLRFFGDLDFYADRKISNSDLSNSSIIPNHKFYFSEDCITGIINNYNIKLAEARLSEIKNKSRSAVFNGLFILIDIDEIKLKLRGKFSGKTVVIADNHKSIFENSKKFQDFNRIEINNEHLESILEIYSTEPSEANKIISNEFLNIICLLKEAVDQSKKQNEHFDNKIAHAFVTLFEKFKLPSLNKSLDAELLKKKSHEEKLDLSKSDNISLENNAINRSIQANLFDDKLLITIPYSFDLFEIDSIFGKAINNEDCKIIFAIIDSVIKITELLDKHFLNNMQSTN